MQSKSIFFSNKKRKEKKDGVFARLICTKNRLLVRPECSALPTALLQHTNQTHTYSDNIVYNIKLLVTFSW